MTKRKRAEQRSFQLGGKGAVLAGVVVLALALWVGSAALQAPASPPLPDESRAPAPDFTVFTLDGREFTLAEHRGEVVAINFMVPGCPSCVAMLPSLARLQEEYASRGVQVLVLNVDPFSYTDRQLLAYKRYIGGGDELWANDLEQAVARSFAVRVIGSTYIIDPQGRLAYWTAGAIPDDILKAEIDKVL